MPDALSVPDVVRQLCPGCGRTDGAFPCPDCGTTPTTYEPQPPERAASGVLMLGGSMVACAILFGVFVPGTVGMVGAGLLGVVGLGLVATSALGIRQPPRPWQVRAEGAEATAMVQGDALLYSLGERHTREVVDGSDHALLAPFDRDALRFGLSQLGPGAPNALDMLSLLARVARGGARAELHRTVRWADGRARPPLLEVVEVKPAPEPTSLTDRSAEGSAEAILAWREAHDALWARAVAPPEADGR